MQLSKLAVITALLRQAQYRFSAEMGKFGMIWREYFRVYHVE